MLYLPENLKKYRILKNLTQEDIAEYLGITPQSVSKWERGLGCPDISLLAGLSNVFNVDLSEMLSGELSTNDTGGGSMKKIKFYVCPNCGNILTALCDTAVSCCGKKLLPLEMQKAESTHKLAVEKIENEYYISTEHEMSKDHYISFVALVSADTIMLRKQYPEWNLQVRIPRFAHGRLIWYCTQHGLFYQNI